ncbi:MAG: lipid-binding protein, partial [Bacteroides sp.]
MMKKYLIVLMAVLSFSFIGCEDTEPGGTSVEKMAGDWWVTAHAMVNGVDKGDVGVGHFMMRTFNTAANTSAEMWIEDGGEFWNYKLKTNVEYTNRSFSTPDFVTNVAYESKVKISEGKVLEGAAKTP